MTRDFRRGMSELAGIIPRIFWLDPPPTACQIIVVDWLHHEVDDRAEIKMPLLVHIVGHQNIEVFHYLADTRAYRDAQKNSRQSLWRYVVSDIDNLVADIARTRMSLADDQPPTCSARTTRGGSR